MYRPVGIVTALVTPFSKDGNEINEGVMRSLIKSQVEKKVHAICVAAANGEFSSLTDAELKRLYEIAVDEAGGKIKVIVYTGCSTTRQTLDLTRHAQGIGADAVMIMPPYFTLASYEEIYQHYKTIVSKTNIPIILFSNPRRGHHDLTPEFINRLAEIENITGIKDSTFDAMRLAELVRVVGDKISVIVGVGSMTLPALCVGAKGVLSGYTMLAPELALELYHAFEKGNSKRAREIHLKLYPLMRLASNAQNIKAFAELMGFPVGPPRPPLLPASEEDRKKIREVLNKLKLI